MLNNIGCIFFHNWKEINRIKAGAYLTGSQNTYQVTLKCIDCGKIKTEYVVG